MSHPTPPTDSKLFPTPVPSARAALLWLLRVVILAAIGLSAYLAWTSFTGATAAGCGRGGVLDCEHVLKSKWSTWLGLPVSLSALTLWLTAIVVSAFAGPISPPTLRRIAGLLLTTLTTAALVAAVWFVGLQATALEHICFYCVAAHGCALVTWLLVVGALARPISWAAIAIGVVLGATVPLGQYLLPPPALYSLHRVVDEHHDDPLILDWPAPANRPEKSRLVTMIGGQAQVDVAALPHLGAVDADYVVVKLFDYACFHCRKLHHELLEAQTQYGGRLTVVLLPVPMSHECNDLIKPEASTSPDACELAKLALIVWRLKPEQFREFDAWLFEPEDPRTYVDARRKAVELISEPALAAAESDDSFDEQIARNIDLYDISRAEYLPQIMGKNVVLSEQVESVAELLDLLQHEFGFARP